ncbi:MAG: endoglycosylceramidase, partial [Streptomyces sp.]|nr:endoglycosylceramidase [Streptomyces sp.]
MPNIRTRLLVVLVVLFGSLSVAGPTPATAAPLPDSLWFDETPLTVRNGRFVDGNGREVVLRGYNVSGETKLKENNGLPFASTADAKKSATALRALGGGNSVRFLLSWA